MFSLYLWTNKQELSPAEYLNRPPVLKGVVIHLISTNKETEEPEEEGERAVIGCRVT